MMLKKSVSKNEVYCKYLSINWKDYLNAFREYQMESQLVLGNISIDVWHVWHVYLLLQRQSFHVLYSVITSDTERGI